jgi:hypothetical protein
VFDEKLPRFQELGCGSRNISKGEGPALKLRNGTSTYSMKSGTLNCRRNPGSEFPKDVNFISDKVPAAAAVVRETFSAVLRRSPEPNYVIMRYRENKA